MLRALSLPLAITLTTLTTLVGCSSDDTYKEKHAYTDEAGRSCTATLEKTSSSSPSVGQSVACDGAGRTCSESSTSCFVLSLDSTTRTLRNCPACCSGSASSFYNADCSNLVCSSDSDCVYAEAACVEGHCECASGFCE